MTLKKQISSFWNSSFEKARGASSDEKYKLDKQPYRGKATTRVKDKKTRKVVKYKYPKTFSGIKKSDSIKNIKTEEVLEVEKAEIYHVIGKTKDGKRHMFMDPSLIKKVKIQEE